LSQNIIFRDTSNVDQVFDESSGLTIGFTLNPFNESLFFFIELKILLIILVSLTSGAHELNDCLQLGINSNLLLRRPEFLFILEEDVDGIRFHRVL